MRTVAQCTKDTRETMGAVLSAWVCRCFLFAVRVCLLVGSLAIATVPIVVAVGHVHLFTFSKMLRSPKGFMARTSDAIPVVLFFILVVLLLSPVWLLWKMLLGVPLTMAFLFYLAETIERMYAKSY